MDQVILVDGYNMIGDWPELRELADSNLEDARDRLAELLANYQGFSGKRIILVFDAYQIPGSGSQFKQSSLEIVYTKEKETADECIERLVGELSSRKTVIYVATSDMTEQNVSFGKGALRLSARELYIAVKDGELLIREQLSDPPGRQASLDNALTDDIKALLEKWRRGQW